MSPSHSTNNPASLPANQRPVSVLCDHSTNQRPVSVSCDHTWPIRGQRGPASLHSGGKLTTVGCSNLVNILLCCFNSRQEVRLSLGLCPYFRWQLCLHLIICSKLSIVSILRNCSVEEFFLIYTRNMWKLWFWISLWFANPSNPHPSIITGMRRVMYSAPGQCTRRTGWCNVPARPGPGVFYVSLPCNFYTFVCLLNIKSSSSSQPKPIKMF